MGFAQNTFGGEGAMTRLLLGMCLVMFALCVATDRDLPIWSGGFRISTIVRFGGLIAWFGRNEPWRCLSAVFLHFSVLHIGMNLWSLSSIGPSCERHFGRARFVILFTVSGLLGFVASEWWYDGHSPPTVGASGAIFGTIGSVIGVAWARRDPNWKQILVQNGVNMLIIGIAFSANNAAHVGGFAAGALLGFGFSKETRRLKLDIPFGILAAVLLVASLASVGLSWRSPLGRAVQAQESLQER